jgi:amino acid transporter
MTFARWRRRAAAPKEEEDSIGHRHTGFVARGNLQYAMEKGENHAGPAYQEVSGAPVETRSPLGYTVGPITIAFLNLSKMVGTGVYSTPASVLTNTGSVGLSLIYWFIGLIIAGSSLSVYLEYASYFPSRSGSEVVYLEQAYPRPRYFFPVTFAIQTVLLSFSSSNTIVLAQYLFRINGHSPTAWELKGVAVAGYTVAVLLVIFHTRFSYFLSNGIGLVKVITLVFVAITGFVVLGGHTRVEHPTANFHNAFESAGTTPYGLTNALVKIIFSYQGYENAFNVVNEIKNPVQRIRFSGGISLLAVAILYMLANIAYFAAVPKAELQNSSQIAASLFFQHVFGSSGAVKGLNFLIALSAFGNLLAVLLGQSRLIRECGRYCRDLSIALFAQGSCLAIL